MKTSELAKLLTDDIFKDGSEPGDPCQRIQFMGGIWPNNETILGGYAKESFQNRLETLLRMHFGDNINSL